MQTKTDQLEIIAPFMSTAAVAKYARILTAPNTKTDKDAISFFEYSGHTLSCYDQSGRYQLRLPKTATKQSSIPHKISYRRFLHTNLERNIIATRKRLAMAA